MKLKSSISRAFFAKALRWHPSRSLELLRIITARFFRRARELDKPRQHIRRPHGSTEQVHALGRFLVLFSYVAWFSLDCAMDESCHLVCRASGGCGCCYTQRSSPAETGH